jgi:hypothetical protein
MGRRLALRRGGRSGRGPGRGLAGRTPALLGRRPGTRLTSRTWLGSLTWGTRARCGGRTGGDGTGRGGAGRRARLGSGPRRGDRRPGRSGGDGPATLAGPGRGAPRVHLRARRPAAHHASRPRSAGPRARGGGGRHRRRRALASRTFTGALGRGRGGLGWGRSLRLGRTSQAGGVGPPADAVSLGVLDRRGMALDPDPELEAQVERFLVGQPQLTSQLVDPDLLRHVGSGVPLQSCVDHSKR